MLELLTISGTIHIIHKGGLVHTIVINGPVGCLCQNILLQVIPENARKDHAADDQDHQHGGSGSQSNFDSGEGHRAQCI